MIKLVEVKGELPPYLFIRGAHRIGDNAISGGGSADIWKGKIDGKTDLVALKVLRVFDRSQGGEAVLKVSRALSLYLMAFSRMSTVILAILQRSHDMEVVKP